MAKNTLAVVPTEKVKEQHLETYFSDGRILKYAKAETIIDGLDEPDGVYIIKEGFFKA